MSSDTVVVEREFNCSQDTLFRWLSNAELMASWFGPKGSVIERISWEPKVGNSYSIELVIGSRSPFNIVGKFIEVIQPDRMVFSLTYEGLSVPPPNSTVIIETKANGTKSTSLRLVQQFITTPQDISGRAKAWEFMLDVLASSLGDTLQ